MRKIILNAMGLSLLLSDLSVAQTYKAGDIAIKPLGINFYSYTFGYNRVVAKINGFDIDTYRPYPALSGNRADRAGNGYDFELSYMFTKTFEAFVLAGFTIERPLQSSGTTDPLSGTAIVGFFPVNDFFHFKRRTTFNVSGGGRYYIDICSNSWVPFVGFSVGGVFQSKTRAKVFDHNPYGQLFGVPNNVYLGKATLLKAKSYVDGALQVGIDYKFTERWCLTMMTGLQYHPRSRAKVTYIKDQHTLTRTIKYRDNWNKWTMPFVVSLKIVF